MNSDQMIKCFPLINYFKYLSLLTKEFESVAVCYLPRASNPRWSEQESALLAIRSSVSVTPLKDPGNCPFFNGCFEVQRIIISLEVLKFPRRNPPVLLVLRLLSFYTFDRLPAASVTKLMADGEKVKEKTWLIMAITPADTNYQWL